VHGRVGAGPTRITWALHVRADGYMRRMSARSLAPVRARYPCGCIDSRRYRRACGLGSRGDSAEIGGWMYSSGRVLRVRTTRSVPSTSSSLPFSYHRQPGLVRRRAKRRLTWRSLCMLHTRGLRSSSPPLLLSSSAPLLLCSSAPLPTLCSLLSALCSLSVCSLLILLLSALYPYPTTTLFFFVFFYPPDFFSFLLPAHYPILPISPRNSVVGGDIASERWVCTEKTRKGANYKKHTAKRRVFRGTAAFRRWKADNLSTKVAENVVGRCAIISEGGLICAIGV